MVKRKGFRFSDLKSDQQQQKSPGMLVETRQMKSTKISKMYTKMTCDKSAVSLLQNVE